MVSLDFLRFLRRGNVVHPPLELRSTSRAADTEPAPASRIGRAALYMVDDHKPSIPETHGV